ncbi:acyltransferase [Pedobacter jamesrossensis]|uniref:Acyltransferase n=1 Tax=Pedobacter jamesrossensis TaxID=1908238 RepID=A0ABV8NI11_9SPHI
MKTSNIYLGEDVIIDISTTVNNVLIGDSVKIAKNCSIFGSKENLLEIGKGSYIGMGTLLNGFSNKLFIGENVSVAQNVNIMTDSGPNASAELQKFFPIVKGPVRIGNHSWIGANVVIAPNVELGEFCVVAANSFVNRSFSSHSVIGGNPARILKKIKIEDQRE